MSGKYTAHLRRMVRIALFAAFLCLTAPLTIPIGPIPVTLAFFTVLLTGALLGPLDGAAATLLYLFLGGIGLPVFSGANAGFGVFAGPTGGYLWSYPLMALVAGFLCTWLLKKSKGQRLVFRSAAVFFSLLPAVLLGYACGTVQFTMVAHTTVRGALAVCVVPFIPVDLCKCAAVAVITPKVKSALQNLNG